MPSLVGIQYHRVHEAIHALEQEALTIVLAGGAEIDDTSLHSSAPQLKAVVPQAEPLPPADDVDLAAFLEDDDDANAL